MQHSCFASRSSILGTSSAVQDTSISSKIRGTKKGSAILPTNDVPVSPKSPFFASLYLIAEQIPSRILFAKIPATEPFEVPKVLVERAALPLIRAFKREIIDTKFPPDISFPRRAGFPLAEASPDSRPTPRHLKRRTHEKAEPPTIADRIETEDSQSSPYPTDANEPRGSACLSPAARPACFANEGRATASAHDAATARTNARPHSAVEPHPRRASGLQAADFTTLVGRCDL
jgi:hypothetical protein